MSNKKATRLGPSRAVPGTAASGTGRLRYQVKKKPSKALSEVEVRRVMALLASIWERHL